jgi:hypothetical protein
VQGRSTLSDKILTEKEKYRLEYSENPDFLQLKTSVRKLVQILVPSTLHLVTAMLPLSHLEVISINFILNFKENTIGKKYFSHLPVERIITIMGRTAGGI